MDKYKKQHEVSSSNLRFGASDPSREPGSVRQTESSKPLISGANPLTYNPTSHIVEWLSQVESAKEDRRSPSTASTPTSASQPPENNVKPVTPSVTSTQQATTAPVPPPPIKKFEYKKVRRGALLGLGGSGGWVPASYVWVRVPVATTSTVVPAQPGQPLSSPILQDDTEHLGDQDQSKPLVAPPNSVADAESTSNVGEPTGDINGKPRG